jgi:hypothetical protein
MKLKEFISVKIVFEKENKNGKTENHTMKQIYGNQREGFIFGLVCGLTASLILTLLVSIVRNIIQLF